MKNQTFLSRWLVPLLFVAAGGVLVAQYKTVRELRSEIEMIKSQAQGPTGESDLAVAAQAQNEPMASATRVTDVALGRRVSSLEDRMARLSSTTSYLMERGQIPLDEAQAGELLRRFMNPSAEDSDRLRALRLLRRNGKVNEEVLTQALGWLQSATDPETRRQLLQQMEGLTNASLKGPLMALMATETDGRVRESIMEGLRPFIQDPQVEASLWDMLRNDPDPDVREEAADALTRGRVSPERLAGLQRHVQDPATPLSERLVAFEALRRSDMETPESIAFLAALSQTTQDPMDKVRIFQALDGVNDPSMKDPLLQGLQDPNPAVREEAVDALSGFGEDPKMRELFKFLAENDADSEVRREALRALNEGRD